jgi:hypothetical protein
MESGQGRNLMNWSPTAASDKCCTGAAEPGFYWEAEVRRRPGEVGRWAA